MNFGQSSVSDAQMSNRVLSSSDGRTINDPWQTLQMAATRQQQVYSPLQNIRLPAQNSNQIFNFPPNARNSGLSNSSLYDVQQPSSTVIPVRQHPLAESNPMAQFIDNNVSRQANLISRPSIGQNTMPMTAAQKEALLRLIQQKQQQSFLANHR